MRCCTDVHESLNVLINLIYVNSEQHIETFGKAGKREIKRICRRIFSGFNAHKLFDLAEFRLNIFSTRLIASDNINCDKAETFSEKIQKSLDGVCIEDTMI